MDHLKHMSITQLLLVARSAKDPIEAAKQLLTLFGAELSNAVRDELTEREERLKAMKRETKLLAISFAE